MSLRLVQDNSTAVASPEQGVMSWGSKIRQCLNFLVARPVLQLINCIACSVFCFWGPEDVLL